MIGAVIAAMVWISWLPNMLKPLEVLTGTFSLIVVEVFCAGFCAELVIAGFVAASLAVAAEGLDE